MSNLQTNCRLTQISTTWTIILEAINDTSTISAPQGRSVAKLEYPSREHKFDIKESDRNIFNPIF